MWPGDEGAWESTCHQWSPASKGKHKVNVRGLGELCFRSPK